MNIDVRQSLYLGRPSLDFFDKDKPPMNFRDRDLPMFSLNINRARVVAQHFDAIQRFVEEHKDF